MKVLLIFLILLSGMSSSAFSAKDSSLNDHPDPAKYCFEEYQISLDTVCDKSLFHLVYEWMEVEYKFAGDTKEGVDCSGFVANIYHSWKGITLSGGSRDIYKNISTVKRADLKEGDLVFFKIHKGRISHVGIYLGNNKFAHSTTHAGVIISDLNEAYYRKYYFGAGEIIERN